MITIHIPKGACLDPYLKANRTETTFVLESGAYTLGTGWAFNDDFDHCCLGPGCSLLGAGSRETQIYCVDEDTVPEGAKQVELFTAGNRSGECRHVRVEGVQIVSCVPGTYGIVGLHVWSSQSVIRDVAVLDIRGYRPDREGFGVLVNEAGIPTTGLAPSIVEDVTVSIRAGGDDGYVCGCYIGLTYGALAVARNILVENVGGAPAHAAFGTNGGVRWSAVANRGRWQRAIFCDTSGGEGTIFSGSSLTAENVLVEFRGGDKIRWKDILVTDSLLTIPNAPRTYAAGLVLAHDAGPPEFDNVAVQNCTLRATGAGPFYAGSIDSPGKGSGIFHSRLLGGPWGKAQVAGGFGSGFADYGNWRGV